MENSSLVFPVFSFAESAEHGELKIGIFWKVWGMGIPLTAINIGTDKLKNS